MQKTYHPDMSVTVFTVTDEEIVNGDTQFKTGADLVCALLRLMAQHGTDLPVFDASRAGLDLAWFYDGKDPHIDLPPCLRIG